MDLSRRGVRTSAWTAVAALVAGALVGVAVPAAAEPFPPAGVPATVTADALPTVQINGVVWNQQIAGDRVYVGGDFTTARPAGAPAGTNEVAQPYLLAYDLATGELISSWNPAPNAQVRDLSLSPDGSTLYVAGNFTSIAGQTRYRVAAFDARTGALLPYKPTINAPVVSISAGTDAVAIGGTFTSVNSQARNNVAALSTAPAGTTTLPFNPTKGTGSIQSVLMSPDGTAVAVAGSFTTMNGSSNPGYGIALLDLASSALRPLPANTYIRDGGTNSAILSLESDGTNFYGSGYAFGKGGNVEGSFAVSWATGAMVWVEDCHGDTYSAFPAGDAVYSASHKHYCGNSGGFPQTEPWTFHRATATTKDARGVNTADIYGYPHHAGQARPEFLHWYPEIDAGSYTGKSQGPWTVSGNDRYVLYGGEFTKVNNKPQQGLVRFAVSSIAPNKEAPDIQGSNWAVSTVSRTPGVVRIGWDANSDPDDESLTYRVYRDSINSTPIYETTVRSNFWRKPAMTAVDTGVAPGSTPRYRVTATDPSGNVVRSDWASVTVPDGTPPSGYAAAVLSDGALDYWRLGESSGTTARDSAGTYDGKAGTGVTWGQAGAIAGSTDKAARFSGSSSGGLVATQTAVDGPQTFSIEAWFRTTTRNGGRIVGFGNRSSGASTSADRILAMDQSGRVTFSVAPSNQTTTITSTRAYNDDRWHQAVVTLGSGGMALYVDGEKVASRTDITSAKVYTGYWRIGGDSSSYFAGTVDEVSVYGAALTAQQVLLHQQHALGTVPNQPPTAAFSTATSDLRVDVDASASSDSDGSVASYAWSFSDGGSASGRTASHTFAAPGTYGVTLTVTDDSGATATTTKNVTVTVANRAPTASFTASTADLSVSLDAGASSDPDGTVVSYAWSFSDGGSASGRTASHTFAAAGTYGVTLTVTDDGGATASATKQVTVSTPAPPGVLAKDGFGRTVSGGWGTAAFGGAWTSTGAATQFSVDGSAGVHTVKAGATAIVSSLADVSSDRTDAVVSVTPAVVPNGGGAWVVLQGRVVGSDYYAARLRLQADGSVQLFTMRTGTALTGVTVAGLTYGAGDTLLTRVQVVGTSPTTIRAKVWRSGTAEPTAWTTSTTDATVGLQAPGSVGITSYLFGTATNGPLVLRYDDLDVTQVP